MISQITAAGVSPARRAKIDRAFGLARPHQHAAVAGDQRKDMARRHDMLRPVAGRDGGLNRMGAVGGGNTGRHAFPRLDGNGKGGLESRAVLRAHQRQAEAFDLRPLHREADQAAPVFCHEVDSLGGRELRRNDQIALVFAVLVVAEDEHAPAAGLVDDLFRRGDSAVNGSGLVRYDAQCHDGILPCSMRST